MMPWTEFAKILFTLEDADPMYYVLARVNIPTAQKMRFMTAWCTFYNPGIAAKASEYQGDHFWNYIRKVYPGAKRASERRHFRGKAGLNALQVWQTKFRQPEKLVEHMQGKTYFDVREKATVVPLIGDYFVWKFADVQERVFREPCDFTNAEKFSPKVPQQGAKMIYPDQSIAETYAAIAEYMNYVLKMKAPPWYDREMNMQEAETVCCVYKQYRFGKWLPHTRTAKATRSLLSVQSKTAEEMLRALHIKTKLQRKDMDEWQTKILATLKH